MTRTQAISVFSQIKSGVSQEEIARRMGMSQASISNLWTGRTHPEFSHLRPQRTVDPHPRGEQHGMAKLTEEQVEQVLLDLKRGVTLKVFARRLKVTSQNISSIKKRRTWKHVTVILCTEEVA